MMEQAGKKSDELMDVSGWTDSVSVSCRSNSRWDRPVEGVELHGQHGVCLQGGVGVVGRRPRLLTQVPSVDWRCHQTLQDLLC